MTVAIIGDLIWLCYSICIHVAVNLNFIIHYGSAQFWKVLEEVVSNQLRTIWYNVWPLFPFFSIFHSTTIIAHVIRIFIILKEIQTFVNLFWNRNRSSNPIVVDCKDFEHCSNCDHIRRELIKNTSPSQVIWKKNLSRKWDSKRPLDGLAEKWKLIAKCNNRWLLLFALMLMMCPRSLRQPYNTDKGHT